MSMISILMDSSARASAYTCPIDVWGMVSPPRDDQQSVTMFARRYAVQFWDREN